MWNANVCQRVAMMRWVASCALSHAFRSPERRSSNSCRTTLRCSARHHNKQRSMKQNSIVSVTGPGVWLGRRVLRHAPSSDAPLNWVTQFPTLVQASFTVCLASLKSLKAARREFFNRCGVGEDGCVLGESSRSLDGVDSGCSLAVTRIVTEERVSVRHSARLPGNEPFSCHMQVLVLIEADCNRKRGGYTWKRTDSGARTLTACGHLSHASDFASQLSCCLESIHRQLTSPRNMKHVSMPAAAPRWIAETMHTQHGANKSVSAGYVCIGVCSALLVL